MLTAIALATVLAQSDPSEWVPPPVTPVDAGWVADGGLAADAPVEEQSPGSALRTPAVGSAASADGGVAVQAEVEVPAPDPRRFTWGHLALAVMGALGSTGYFAVRIEAGAVYGWPRRMDGSLNRARGPTVGLALDLLAAKVRVTQCGTAGVCGSRYQGGLAVRGAYNWGVIGNDAVVAPIHSVFVQAVPFLSSNSVPSAPLFPGSTWGEHGVRFDVGLTSGFLRGSTWPKPGAFVIGGGLYVALSLEWLLVTTENTGTFRGGLSLGVGL
jgi:hypothetical protein